MNLYISSLMDLAQNDIKKLLGKKAAELVAPGMLVGLGTGTTATFFIEALVNRCQKENLNIRVVASSNRSQEIAKKGGIPIADMDHVTQIDLTIDGADEVDAKNRMIKGGGGALTREKILASTSKRVVILVDESKLVPELGAFGVPLEILKFGFMATCFKIEKLGYKGNLRKKEDGSLYLTDNGNYIFDLNFPKRYANPEKDHDRIVNVPGVVETGFFFDLPLEVLVGYKDGSLAIKQEKRDGRNH